MQEEEKLSEETLSEKPLKRRFQRGWRKRRKGVRS